jgi:hypothetical protein
MSENLMNKFLGINANDYDWIVNIKSFNEDMRGLCSLLGIEYKEPWKRKLNKSKEYDGFDFNENIKEKVLPYLKKDYKTYGVLKEKWLRQEKI